MSCPHCQSTVVRRRKQRTALGYRRFSCGICRRRFNQRTGTPFNELQFPTDIVLLAVLWRLRYKLGLRDVSELLLQRGYTVSHETVRAWEFRFTPLISANLRTRRRGRAGRSWYIADRSVGGSAVDRNEPAEASRVAAQDMGPHGDQDVQADGRSCRRGSDRDLVELRAQLQRHQRAEHSHVVHGASASPRYRLDRQGEPVRENLESRLN